ncbi:MAG: Helix-turn-helix domain [Actinomycetota bacterium]
MKNRIRSARKLNQCAAAAKDLSVDESANIKAADQGPNIMSVDASPNVMSADASADLMSADRSPNIMSADASANVMSVDDAASIESDGPSCADEKDLTSSDERQRQLRAEALLTVDDVAVLLRLSSKSVYRLVELRHLPGVRRIGRRVRFFRPELLAWMSGQESARPRRSR